ncbi:hypothetical protein PN36_24900 [Candidatus Thiomargarita nelsonii]|uniref:Uncharacterized protein n=1 Tax=Candidatus Thiomargarita nelsonii TaxID=1003181 RepID=A0A0A6PCE7_9GAMM|nr:hypothetical protein PN36_24900 [Candidatus Thiomargarita nelsonii]
MDTTYYSLIERTSPNALRLLKIVTLAEKSVPLSLLTEIWENQAKTASLDSLLAELSALGLLQKDETGEETVYCFDESVRSSLLSWRQNHPNTEPSLSSSPDSFFFFSSRRIFITFLLYSQREAVATRIAMNNPSLHDKQARLTAIDKAYFAIKAARPHNLTPAKILKIGEIKQHVRKVEQKLKEDKAHYQKLGGARS